MFARFVFFNNKVLKHVAMDRRCAKSNDSFNSQLLFSHGLVLNLQALHFVGCQYVSRVSTTMHCMKPICHEQQKSTTLFDKTLFFTQGNIRNTEKLSYDRQQQYEIQVTAWDCGQKRALHSIPVRIDVKPVCKPGWQGGSSSLTCV